MAICAYVELKGAWLGPCAQEAKEGCTHMMAMVAEKAGCWKVQWGNGDGCGEVW